MTLLHRGGSWCREREVTCPRSLSSPDGIGTPSWAAPGAQRVFRGVPVGGGGYPVAPSRKGHLFWVLTKKGSWCHLAQRHCFSYGDTEAQSGGQFPPHPVHPALGLRCPAQRRSRGRSWGHLKGLSSQPWVLRRQCLIGIGWPRERAGVGQAMRLEPFPLCSF